VTTLVITQAAVYADGRLAARVLWSGRMMKIESLRGKGLGRLLPAGFTEGRPDDGRGLYDLWTALHPHVPVPSDRIIAESLPLEECVTLLIEGAAMAARY
jgi:hypothetical protein